jgi:hypothetical protein
VVAPLVSLPLALTLNNYENKKVEQAAGELMPASRRRFSERSCIRLLRGQHKGKGVRGVHITGGKSNYRTADKLREQTICLSGDGF